MITKNKIIPWIPSIVWMSLIFYLSAQPAAESNSLSKGITGLLIEILGRFTSIEVDTSTANVMIAQFNHFVRKLAHFIAYFILGILVMYAFIKNGYKKKTLCVSFLFCVLFAVSDEIHQLFVPGRGGMLRDVILDSLGSLTGIAFYSIGVRRLNG